MNRSRTRAVGLVMTAGATVVLLGGCVRLYDREFGGGNPPDPTVAATPTATCAVRVGLTGALSDSWSGRGEAAPSAAGGPTMVYSTAQAGTEVSVYSTGNGFAGNVLVVRGPERYGAILSAPAARLVRTDGSGARVDVVAGHAGASVRSVHVTAEFVCH